MLNARSDLAPKSCPVIDDGVIKFKYTLKMGQPPLAELVVLLEKWRAILWRLNMIGEYPIERVGYGNLSLKVPRSNNFIITGTQTGALPHLKREHYTKIIDCDLRKNSVIASGSIAPSSESLTHYAIYQANPQIQSIFHIHHKDLWQKMLDEKMEGIEADIPYGTVEMAQAAQRAIKGKDEGVLVMKGHQDGIIAYGITPEGAGRILLKLYRELGPQDLL
jgi:hypothetical protein